MGTAPFFMLLFLSATVHGLPAEENEEENVLDKPGRRHCPPQMTDEEYGQLLDLLLKPVSERAKRKSDNWLYCKAKRLYLDCAKVANFYRKEEVY